MELCKTKTAHKSFVPGWLLDEMGLNRLRKHAVNGIAIISVVNADKELETEIKNRGYVFSRVYYSLKDSVDNKDDYGTAFIIYAKYKTDDLVDFEELKKFAVSACKKFKQDSVYVQEPNGNFDCLDGDGNEVNSSFISFENFRAESASIVEMRRRSASGEILLMPCMPKKFV